MASPRPGARSSLPATAAGTNVHAYAPGDWGLLAAIALIWGSSFLFMEIGLRAFEPGVITLARVGLGVGDAGAVRAGPAAVEREDWPRIAFLGVIWMAIPLLLFPIAQQWITSSVTGMINGAMPIFTVAWATYLLRKLPGWRQLLGIGLGFAGILLVFVPELEAGARRAARRAARRCWPSPSTGWRPTSRCRSSQKYGSLPVVFRAQLVALLVVAPIGPAADARLDLVMGVGPGDAAAGHPGHRCGLRADGRADRARRRTARLDRDLLPAARGHRPGCDSSSARRSRRSRWPAWSSSWPAPGSPRAASRSAPARSLQRGAARGFGSVCSTSAVDLTAGRSCIVLTPRARPAWQCCPGTGNSPSDSRRRRYMGSLKRALVVASAAAVVSASLASTAPWSWRRTTASATSACPGTTSSSPAGPPRTSPTCRPPSRPVAAPSPTSTPGLTARSSRQTSRP